MVIQITSDIRIRTDDHNWIVEKHKTSKKGKEYWSLMGYYRTLPLAVEAVCTTHVQHLMPEEFLTVAELHMFLAKILPEISQTVQEELKIHTSQV